MDPRRLLTFRTVAHERSFSRAAERLSRSQPSVSSQVALLETEVGVRLLERGRRGVRLTPAGRALLEHADHVAWRLQLADTQIAAYTDERRDQVRVGCFPTSLVALVPAALARLRAVQGDIRVLLSEVTPRALEPLLLSGHFNVALSYQNAASPRREIAGVERIDLLRETFLVGLRQPIGSPRTPLDSRWPTSPMKTGSCHRRRASWPTHAARRASSRT